MTSAKIPRRKFSTDSGDSSDDMSRPTPEVQQQRHLYDYNYTPMAKDDEVVESYEYVGCFKHDWEKSSLEYAFHSREMTLDVSKKHIQVLGRLKKKTPTSVRATLPERKYKNRLIYRFVIYTRYSVSAR